jgi:sugar/nucleoside kinase (ribokinase family)
MHECCVVVAGHICLDVIPTMDHVPAGKLPALLQPGHLLITGPALFSTGGPVSTTGLALHRLGISTRLNAKIGADPLGKIVRGIVAGYDPALADGLMADPESATSYSVILSAPEVDRIFIHCPGANDTFCADDVDYALVAKACLLHFGYPPVMRRMYSENGRELIELFQRAKATGVTTSLDMTYPDPDTEGGQADWRKILSGLLPWVDVFLPSFEELMFMLHREESEEYALDGLLQAATPERLSALGAELLEMGAKMVVIKLGHRGLYLRTGNRETIEQMGRAAPIDLAAWAEQELWSSCFIVRVVGTTGSGDATIAGFLSALLRGLNPREAVTAAVAVGACNVEATDALSGLISWEDTLSRIASGWEHLPMNLAAPDWKEVSPGLWEHDGMEG